MTAQSTVCDRATQPGGARSRAIRRRERPGAVVRGRPRPPDGAVRSRTLDHRKAGTLEATLVLANPGDPNVLHVRVVDRGAKPVAGATASIEGLSDA